MGQNDRRHPAAMESPQLMLRGPIAFTGPRDELLVCAVARAHCSIRWPRRGCSVQKPGQFFARVACRTVGW